jgi:hypothetical protein
MSSVKKCLWLVASGVTILFNVSGNMQGGDYDLGAKMISQHGVSVLFTRWLC